MCMCACRVCMAAYFVFAIIALVFDFEAMDAACAGESARACLPACLRFQLPHFPETRAGICGGGPHAI